MVRTIQVFQARWQVHLKIFFAEIFCVGDNQPRAARNEAALYRSDIMPDELLGTDGQSTPQHEMSDTPLGATGGEHEESDEQYSMEAAMAAMGEPGSGFPGGRRLRAGEVIEGVVVHIDQASVLVDVGAKSEGIIKPGELTSDPNIAPEDAVSINETIKVYVLAPDSKEGGPLLSKKRADFEKAWDKVEKAFQDKETIKAMVTDRVKGGLVVDLGIRGFVPASHVQSGKLKNLDKFIGQSLAFKVIEVDRERRKVVLSNRLAEEETNAAKREKTWLELVEGKILDGTVRRITEYGAFVDLGGVDGLLHVSEMSWSRVNHPSEVVKVGQKIPVKILKLNRVDSRVSLGMRQILPDPWEDVRLKYHVGNIIKVTVSRVVPFGAFVQLMPGVEGIIPSSELARRRVSNPEEVVSVGQEVDVKVIDVRPDERRITMSIKQLETQKERERDDQDYRSYSKSQPQDRTTIGELLAAQLEELNYSLTDDDEIPMDEPVIVNKVVIPEKVVEVAPVVEEVVEEAAPEAVEEAPVVEEVAAEVVEEAPVVEEVAAEVVEEAPVVEEVAPEVVEEAPVVEEVVAEVTEEVTEAPAETTEETEKAAE
jgi:4-hydroxy-3-methylbut-2-enyl diphosphate reductase